MMLTLFVKFKNDVKLIRFKITLVEKTLKLMELLVTGKKIHH